MHEWVVLLSKKLFYSEKFEVFDSQNELVVKIFVVNEEAFLVDAIKKVRQLILVARLCHPGVSKLVEIEVERLPFSSWIEFNHECLCQEPVPAAFDSDVHSERSWAV